MQDGKVSDSEKLVLGEMLSIFKERADSYAGLKISMALYRQEQSGIHSSEWRNILTRFEMTPTTAPDGSHAQERQKNTIGQNYDYGDFAIEDLTVEADELPRLAENLVNTGKFAFDENLSSRAKSLKFEGSLGRDFTPFTNLRPSNDPQYRITWPANCFKIEPAQFFRQSPPGTQLVALGLPLYEYGSQAISEIFGIDPQIANQSYGQVLFLLPNFTAKLAKVRLGTKSVLINFDLGTKGIVYQDLVLKVNCLSPQKQQSKQFEETLERDEVELLLDFTPDVYAIYLLTKKGDVLDYRRFNLSWATATDDVEVEKTPENLEQIIARGENEFVEFKLEFPKSNEEFAESVVAMSNTRGGTIFVGVDDHGSVVGIQNQRSQESIRDALRNYCEPSVYPEISKQEIIGKTIIVIQVKDGKDKPYVVKNKGPYVRFGSTDRIATRDEIIRLCASPGSPFG